MARKMAAQRAKPGRKPLGGAAPNAAQRANSLSFFSEDADGWTMSPKTILLFSVAYMGFVILLDKLKWMNTLNIENFSCTSSEK